MAKGMRSNSKRAIRTQHRQSLARTPAFQKKEAERIAAMQTVLHRAEAGQPAAARQILQATSMDAQDSTQGASDLDVRSLHTGVAVDGSEDRSQQRKLKTAKLGPVHGHHKKRKRRGSKNSILQYK